MITDKIMIIMIIIDDNRNKLGSERVLLLAGIARGLLRFWQRLDISAKNFHRIGK